MSRQQLKKLNHATKKASYKRKLSIFLGLTILTISALPLVLVLLVGLLPTITLFITDSKNTNKLFIVSCFNLAGVFSYLVEIINTFTLNQSFLILSNIFNLITMLGSAGIGLILYLELPNLFAFILKTTSEKRLEKINARLVKYTQDWGEDLTKE